MPYPADLNPRDVLAHLHELGYCGITPEQLKDFIHDLKKLIKHDQKKLSNLENIPVGSGEWSPESKVELNHPAKRAYDRGSYRKEEKGTSMSYSESETSSYTTSSILSKESCSSGDSLDEDKHSESSRLCKPGYKSKSMDVMSQHSRAQSAFIRPWKLGSSGTTSQKTDPVTLYHKYQEIWKNQKVPGENSHSDLRWQIREKMLGQDPNPRPVTSIPGDSHRRKVNRI